MVAISAFEYLTEHEVSANGVAKDVHSTNHYESTKRVSLALFREAR